MDEMALDPPLGLGHTWWLRAAHAEPYAGGDAHVRSTDGHAAADCHSATHPHPSAAAATHALVPQPGTRRATAPGRAHCAHLRPADGARQRRGGL